MGQASKYRVIRSALQALDLINRSRTGSYWDWSLWGVYFPIANLKVPSLRHWELTARIPPGVHLAFSLFSPLYNSFSSWLEISNIFIFYWWPNAATKRGKEKKRKEKKRKEKKNANSPES